MMEETKVKDQDERSEWVAPAIKEWDIVTETQSGFKGSGVDNNIYS